MIRRLGLATIVFGVTFVLSGCFGMPARADISAIEAALVEIEGVTEASVGAFNSGAPGRNMLRAELVVDEIGLADLPGVLDSAIDIVAADASGWSGYEFSASALDASSPTGTIGLSLDRRLTDDDVPAGTLGPSLALTPDELRMAAER